ncbi:cuticle protein 18.7-like [Euwallacea fornicatus]|uniref:cuticle protein 18.7-like n=1 Tax=Euwallacea fornicatus TaxID=995702 RepID=UPI00338E3FAD
MKFLVLVSYVLAVASAIYVGPQHIPVIGPNGVPVEPHEVQAARASHLAALASAHSGVSVAAPYYGSAPFTAFSGIPSLGHNALPLDTPEVASAKLQHYHDFAVAAERNGVHAPLYSSPIIAGNYPADTPEVQVAKAAHFAAHAEALSRSGPTPLTFFHSRKRRDVYGAYHIPVIGPNGVPQETPEVQAAKAHHFAALAEAATRGGPAQYAPYNSGAYVDDHQRYYGPYAEIGHDGQPRETQEVKAAKAYHFAAYSQALSGHPGHYY